jgi:hypothetical protein
MATTLTTLRDRLEVTLQDTGNTTWSTDDLDEAIRRALEVYSTVHPYETITTVTLSSAGREVDLSSLTGRIQVTRVWWPYSAADPEYPPNWCTFEEWGDTLFLDTDSEPAASDGVRVWYTTLQTLSGLDAATATTLPPDADSLIVSGAAGYAARERAAELAEKLNVDRDVVQKLRAYADEKLAEFAASLSAKSRQLAAQASGVAQAARLDRWDRGSDEQW